MAMWSEKDELGLLRAVLEIAREPVESYNPSISLFVRINKFLENHYTDIEIRDKVDELRKLYNETLVAGGAATLKTPALELCETIWRPAPEKKEPVADDGALNSSLQLEAHHLATAEKQVEAADPKLASSQKTVEVSTKEKKVEDPNSSETSAPKLASSQQTGEVFTEEMEIEDPNSSETSAPKLAFPQKTGEVSTEEKKAEDPNSINLSAPKLASHQNVGEVFDDCQQNRQRSEQNQQSLANKETAAENWKKRSAEPLVLPQRQNWAWRPQNAMVMPPNMQYPILDQPRPHMSYRYPPMPMPYRYLPPPMMYPPPPRMYPPPPPYAYPPPPQHHYMQRPFPPRY